MEIRRVDTLSEADHQTLLGWGEDLFDVSSLGLQWRKKDLHFVLYEEGGPKTLVSVLRHEMPLGVIGGVGSVISLPEARGRGHARRVLERATGYLRDDMGAAFGLLFCLPRLVPFYESQGWRVVEQGVIIDQPGGKIPAPSRVMVLPFTERHWPAERVELGSLPW